MGISSVGGMESLSGAQMAMASPVDTTSKSIENKISDVQRQMQQLSSKQGMSAEEKMRKRQELQQEVSSLYTQLRQHQSEVRKEQRRDAVAEKVLVKNGAAKRHGTAQEGSTAKKSTVAQESEQAKKSAAAQESGMAKESSAAKESGMAKGTDAVNESGMAKGSAAAKESGIDKGDVQSQGTGLSAIGMRAMSTADTSMERARRQGMVVARIEGGIAILISEISQDEARGVDVERKQAEREKLEEKAVQASASRFLILGEAHQTMRESVQAGKNGAEANGAAKTGVSLKDRPLIQATNYAKENAQAAQRWFYMPVDIRG